MKLIIWEVRSYNNIKNQGRDKIVVSIIKNHSKYKALHVK